MKNIQHPLENYRLSKGMTQRELSDMLEIDPGNYTKIKKGILGLSDDVKHRIRTKLNLDPETFDIVKQPVNIQNEAVVIGEIPHPDDLENKTIQLSHNKFIKIIPLVPLTVSAGYTEHYSDLAYINENFEPFVFIATSHGHGNYVAFVIRGDSMDDGSDQSIKNGYIVVGREIQRHHWRNPLHLHRFEDYVIIQPDIMTCKRIIKHDTEKGTITCRSLNPDKDKYFDFDLNLDDCLQIFNIVSVTNTR